MKLISDNELYHHGIVGMKWGVRRYQNKDGTLTAAGKKRYGTNVTEEDIDAYKRVINRSSNGSKDSIGYGKVISAIDDLAENKQNKLTIEWSIGKANAAKKEYYDVLDKAFDEAMNDIKTGKYGNEAAWDEVSDIYMMDMLNNPKSKHLYDRNWTGSKEDVDRLRNDFEKIPRDEVTESVKKMVSFDTRIKEIISNLVFVEKYSANPENDYLNKSFNKYYNTVDEANRMIFNVGKDSVRKILDDSSHDIAEISEKISYGDLEVIRTVEKLSKDFQPFAEYWINPRAHDDYPTDAYIDTKIKNVN